MFPEFIHFLQHYAGIFKSMNNNSLSHLNILTFINIVRHRAIFVHLRTKYTESGFDFAIHA